MKQRERKIHIYNTRHCEDLYKIAYKGNSKKYCLSVENVGIYNNLSYYVINIKSDVRNIKYVLRID